MLSRRSSKANGRTPQSSSSTLAFTGSNSQPQSSSPSSFPLKAPTPDLQIDTTSAHQRTRSRSRSHSHSKLQPLASTTADDPPAEPTKVTSPYRSRHQITRSILELYSPIRHSTSTARDSTNTSTVNIAPAAGSSTSISSMADGASAAAASGIGFGLAQTLSHPSGQGVSMAAVPGRREAFERMHTAQMSALAQQQQQQQQLQRPRRLDLTFAGSVESLQGVLAGSGVGGSGVVSPGGSRRACVLGSALGDGVPGLQSVSMEEPRVAPVVLPRSYMKSRNGLGAGVGVGAGAGDGMRTAQTQTQQTQIQTQTGQLQMNMQGMQAQSQLQAALWEEQATLCQAQGVNTLEEMVSNLKEFAHRAMTSTDDSYRSVLMLYLSLQDTVASMRAMVDESESVTSSFIQDTVALEHNIRTQLSALRDLEGRRRIIDEMQGRIKEGRRRMEGLSGRVEKVQETVTRWEAADGEWQERTRKRLRNVWIVMLVVAVVVVGIMVLQGNGIAEEAEVVMEEVPVGVQENMMADSTESKAAAVKVAAAVIRGEQKMRETGGVTSDGVRAGTTGRVEHHDSTSEWDDESLRIVDEL